MKILKRLAFILSFPLLLSSCNENNKSQAENSVADKDTVRTVTTEEVKDKAFDELFTSITAKQIKENVFKLVNEDYTVITAGTPELYNSMVASDGGWGTVYGKPGTWCNLRASRYTLEVIQDKQTYTMSYFDDNFKDEIVRFGKKSGRDSEKMKDSKLTMVETPSGNITYKEAKLIIECQLSQVTTVSPDDFYDQDDKKFVVDAYNEVGGYHKIVFGKITNVWIRK